MFVTYNMILKGTRLPYKRIEYLNNVLDYNNRKSISIYSRILFLERPAEIQLLELFNMMTRTARRNLLVINIF